MLKPFDRVQFATATGDTGSLAVGAATPGFQTPTQAGAKDGDEVRYVITDGTAWEIGRGILSSTQTVLSRALTSSSTGSLLALSGNAKVSFDWAAEDLLGPTLRSLYNLMGQGALYDLLNTPST